MADVALQFLGFDTPLPGYYDLAFFAGDLVPDNSLRTAMLICLFTDRQATPDQLAQAGLDPSDTRGYWGDFLNDDPNDQWGSYLWLLQRETVTSDLVPRAKKYAEDALAILVNIGAASSVKASPYIDDADELMLPISITRPNGQVENYRFANIWRQNFIDPFAADNAIAAAAAGTAGIFTDAFINKYPELPE